MSKVQIKNTDRSSFPRIPPQNKVTDYLKSRQMLKHVQLPTFQTDKPREDVDLHLTTARRHYEATLINLKEKKKFFKEERVKLDEQWKALEALEMSLNTNFENLNTFIKGNEDKRIRAKDRLVEDAKMRRIREKQIESLEKKISYIKQIRTEFDREIQSHLMYEKFLNSVVERDLEFHSSSHIVNRFESLIGTKNDLGRLQAQNFSTLENSKSLMVKKLDQNALQLLGMVNTIANLHSLYQEAIVNCRRWEKVVFSIKSFALQRSKEVNEAKTACRNIYVLMCRRKKEEPKISETNIDKQLMYIKKTLQQLAIVIQKGKEKRRRSVSSTKVEPSEPSVKSYL